LIAEELRLKEDEIEANNNVKESKDMLDDLKDEINKQKKDFEKKG